MAQIRREKDRRNPCDYRIKSDSKNKSMTSISSAFAAAGGQGSTSHLAKLLGIPVVLVVDASGLAGSVSALVQGYKTFDLSLKFAGVILNQVGSERHRELLEEALRGVTTVFGAIPRDEAFCFYYPENAEVVPFSPLRDALPDVDAFYIGGGYPELYASSRIGKREGVPQVPGGCGCEVIKWRKG